MIYLFFFLSGFSALVYEVAWLRLLCFSFGSTAEATSCVLAVFLGGLALGAALGGKYADKLAKGHFALYGAIELCVGLIAPGAAYALYAFPPVLANITGTGSTDVFVLVLLKMLFALMVLLPPTVLMGASLPVLCRHLSLHANAVKGFSSLYAINTLGAVAGSLSACFLGFAYLGIFTTVLLAAALNILVGCGSISFSRRWAEQLTATVAPANNDEQQSELKGGTKWDFVILCILACLGGFTSLGYETIWVRLLRFYTISTTYSFTITVSSFLFGLAIGSFLCRRFFQGAKSYSEHMNNFAFAQAFTGVLCGASVMFLPFAGLIVRNLGTGITSLLAIGLLFVGIPAAAIGLTFPMIGGLATTFKNVGTSVGVVYAINALGCVLGALIVGLCAQPLIGSFESFKLMIVLSAVGGSIALLRSKDESYRLRIVGAGVLPALALAYFLGYKDPFNQIMLELKYPKTIFYGEDATGIGMVIEFNDYKLLRTNSAAVSSTMREAKRYMRLIGVLPVFAAKNPDQALVVCFGTGTTAGATAAVKDVKHVDIVELSPMIIKAGSKFADSNFNVLKNPKVTTYISDGRNFLLNSRKKYDIITFEPPPSTETGVVSLYTEEANRIVHDHLAPGGIVAQWVPLFYESETVWKSEVRSFLKVFAHASLWLSNNDEAVILGSDTPIALQADRIKSQIAASPELAALLDEVGLNTPESLLSTFVLADDKLRQLIGDAPPVTDDRPYMEFYLPFSGKQLSTKALTAAAGLSASELRKSVQLTGIDDEALRKCFQAIEFYRVSETMIQEHAPEASILKAAEEALKCEPGNKFYAWWLNRLRSSPH